MYKQYLRSLQKLYINSFMQEAWGWLTSKQKEKLESLDLEKLERIDWEVFDNTKSYNVWELFVFWWDLYQVIIDLWAGQTPVTHPWSVKLVNAPWFWAIHADNTSVNPSIIAEPTDTEIQTFVTSNWITESIVFYTWDNNESSPTIYTYFVDKWWAVLNLSGESKNKYKNKIISNNSII